MLGARFRYIEKQPLISYIILIGFRVMELQMKHIKLQNPTTNMKAWIKMGSKINEKSNQNQWKSYQKSIKNLSKINENEVHGGVLGRLWGYLGSCWLKVMSFGAILVGFFLPFRSKMVSRCLQDGILGRFGVQVGAQNRPKSIPRAIWNVINFLMDLKIDFWTDLVPSWLPNPSKNEVKLAPKSMQVGVLIWELFCDGFWNDFYWFFAPT